MYATRISLYNLSDEDLMEHLQSGYEAAFSELVTRYQDRIHHFIFRYTKNTQDSEDLVQETFMRVYRCRDSYQRIARFSTWLYTIAGNLVKTHYRKEKRMQLVSINGSNTVDKPEAKWELPDDSFCPDQVVENDMILSHVKEAVNMLSDEFKQIVIMRDIQNLSYEEIMEITGLPMGTVKSRINRARVKLQESLKFYKNS